MNERYVDRGALVADPAAQIRPPNAVQLGHVSGERVTTIDGPQAPFDGYIFGIDQNQDEVRRFYDGELRKLGWTPDPGGTFEGSDELATWSWCKPRMNFRVGVKDQARAYRPDFYQGRHFAVVFDASIVGRDSSLSCPTRVSLSSARITSARERVTDASLWSPLDASG